MQSNCKRVCKILLAMTIICPVLTGCWDRIEIEERAVVLGVAIDEVPEEEKELLMKKEPEVNHLKDTFITPDRMMKLTAQIAVPGRIPLGPAQGSGGGSIKGPEGPVWVLEVYGHTVDDTIMNLQQQLADRLFFGHLRVIVVSEAYARKGLYNVNDYFRRNPEVRRATWLVVAKGEAAKIIEAAPKLERVPALYLLLMIEQAVEMGKLPNIFAGTFWSMTTSQGQEPYLPYIELQENNKILTAGLAYFRGNEMIGTIKPLEIGFFMAVKGIDPGGYSAITSVPGKKGQIMFQTTHRISKIKMKSKNGKPHAIIHMKIEGNVAEKANESFFINNKKKIREIEQEVEKSGEKGILKVIKQTQKDGSDIFGFGEIVRGKKSRYWDQEIRSKSEWQKVYKEMSIELKLEIEIRRMGMKVR